jgi:hypothetical protein
MLLYSSQRCRSPYAISYLAGLLLAVSRFFAALHCMLRTTLHQQP